MKNILKPINAKSLKEEFISRFEHLILSGKFSIGQKLPPERELAKHLKVSRPVVHEGLVDLATKGLITLKPRKGSIVNDYRKDGSLALLMSLINYKKGDLEPEILGSLLDARILFETEAARLAALNRTKKNLSRLDEILKEEARASINDIELITEIDFNFHHIISISSANIIYSLLINSFRPVFLNFLFKFFQNPSVIPIVFEYHRELVSEIRDKNTEKSMKIMKKILLYGEEQLRKTINLSKLKPGLE